MLIKLLLLAILIGVLWYWQNLAKRMYNKVVEDFKPEDKSDNKTKDKDELEDK